MVDAALIYVMVKWVLPFLIAAVVFLVSTTAGGLILMEIVGLLVIVVTSALGAPMPAYRPRPAYLLYMPTLGFGYMSNSGARPPQRPATQSKRPDTSST